MTTYESTTGSVVHVELYSDDPDATQAFYEDAFGWTFDVDEAMDYRSWRAPNPPAGGLMARGEGPLASQSTLFYVGVDDLDATRTAIEAAGGEILEPEIEIPQMGALTLYREPGGVVEAAWEDRSAGDAPEDGWPMFTDDPDAGSLTHFELYSTDPEATRAFHETVYGWTFDTIGEGEYTMARPPTPPSGGLMAATDEWPAGTMAYLLVDSAVDACAAIEAAGGQVLREPFAVEGWGTMAVFEAPGGVVQAVWENWPEVVEGGAAEGEQTRSAGS